MRYARKNSLSNISSRFCLKWAYTNNLWCNFRAFIGSYLKKIAVVHVPMDCSNVRRLYIYIDPTTADICDTQSCSMRSALEFFQGGNFLNHPPKVFSLIREVVLYFEQYLNFFLPMKGSLEIFKSKKILPHCSRSFVQETCLTFSNTLRSGLFLCTLTSGKYAKMKILQFRV